MSSTVAQVEPAAATEPELPAAADRIVKVEELKTPVKVDEATGEETGGTPYVMVTTVRGVVGYSFKQIDNAKAFLASQAPVDLTTDKDNAGRVRVTGIAAFDALGGAGQ